MITGFAMGAKFRLDKDEYDAELRLGANPQTTIVNFKAKILELKSIVGFVAAVVGESIDVPGLDILSFHDVDIYSSLGCIWLGQHYPQGFRFKGLVHVCGFEASMDASLTVIGFHLLTKIKGFKVGPLTVKGAKKSLMRSLKLI